MPGLILLKGPLPFLTSYSTRRPSRQMSLVKPVHLITNDQAILHHIFHYGFSQNCIYAQDEEGSAFHRHLYIEYGVNPTTGALSPARKNFVRYARRQQGCTYCRDQDFNYHCPECNLYYKFIWPKNDTHTENIKEYILAKPKATTITQ